MCFEPRGASQHCVCSSMMRPTECRTIDQTFGGAIDQKNGGETLVIHWRCVGVLVECIWGSEWTLTQTSVT